MLTNQPRSAVGILLLVAIATVAIVLSSVGATASRTPSSVGTAPVGPAAGGVALASSVLTPGGAVPIQKVTLGMAITVYVASTDQATTGRVLSISYSTVTQAVEVNHGWLFASATNLPVYVRNGNSTGWIASFASLALGEQILLPSGHVWLTVGSVQIVRTTLTVVNLGTSGPDTFVANGVLV